MKQYIFSDWGLFISYSVLTYIWVYMFSSGGWYWYPKNRSNMCLKAQFKISYISRNIRYSQIYMVYTNIPAGNLKLSYDHAPIDRQRVWLKCVAMTTNNVMLYIDDTILITNRIQYSHKSIPTRQFVFELVWRPVRCANTCSWAVQLLFSHFTCRYSFIGISNLVITPFPL